MDSKTPTAKQLMTEFEEQENERDPIPQLKMVACLRLKPEPLILDLEDLQTAYLDKDIPLRTFVKWWLAVKYGKEAVFNLNAADIALEMSGQVGKRFISVSTADVLKALADLMKKHQLKANTNIQLELNLS